MGWNCCAILGASHRKYRHDPNTTPKEAKAIFGENADNACLDHIRLDELESRSKSGLIHEPVEVGKRNVVPHPYLYGFLMGASFLSALFFVAVRSWWVVIPFLILYIFFLLAFVGSLMILREQKSQ
jgi:hypothetical protein